MPPLMISCRYGDTPIMLSPLLSTPSSSAPTRVPTIAPRPPAIEVPPITTAAMASSSKPTPTPGWPLVTREACTMPATAAVKPLSAYTSSL